MNNHKTWTINVQVNTKYLTSLTGTGSWGNPIGGDRYWRDNVKMTAINDQDNQIYSASSDHFSLEIKPGDKVRWILSEVDPLINSDLTLVMYGFKQGTNWDDCFTELDSVTHEMQVTTIKGYAFNNPEEPKDTYWNLHPVDVSVPETTARNGAKPGSSVKYLIKLLLIDSEKKEILKYAQVDPYLKIK